MIIYNATLYKTPLSPDYRNVYDNYSTLEEYSNFLKSFPYANYNINSRRSIRTFNGNGELRLIADYETIKEFNYIEIRDSPFDSPTFFFITSIDQINDSGIQTAQSNPVCIIRIERDVFTSNYLDYIFNDNHLQFCSRMHRNSLEFMGDYYKVINDGVKKIDTLTNIVQTTSLSGNIVYLQIRFSNDVKFYTNPDYTGEVRPFNSNLQREAPICYIPIYLSQLTKYESQFTFGIKTARFEGDTPSSNSFYITNHSYAEMPRFNGSQDILDLSVTLNCAKIIGEYDGGAIVRGRMLYTKLSLESGDLPLTVLDPLPNTESGEYLENSIYDGDIDLSGRFEFNGYVSNDFNSMYENADFTKTYPFVKYFLFINGQKIEILPSNDYYKLAAKINCTNSSTPTLEILINNRILPVKIIQSNLPAIIRNDSLEIFLRNNKTSQYSSMALQTLTSTITAVFSAILAMHPATSMISTIGASATAIGASVNIVGAPLSIASSHEDADRKLDAFNIPAFIGTDDYYLDGVYLLKEEIENDNDKKSLFYDFQMFGNYYNNYASVSENYRQFFDFVKTEGCDLHFIPNIEERKILEAAFNNGVTKWHIDTDFDTPVISMSHKYNNISRR